MHNQPHVPTDDEMTKALTPNIMTHLVGYYLRFYHEIETHAQTCSHCADARYEVDAALDKLFHTDYTQGYLNGQDYAHHRRTRRHTSN